MDIEKKLELIKRNTQEIVTEDELRKLLKTKKQPVVYLGTAITGRPHIGYFVWALKLGDFLRAGFKVKLLLADLHGALDNTPWEILEMRYDYYKALIPLLFEAIGYNPKLAGLIYPIMQALDEEYLKVDVQYGGVDQRKIFMFARENLPVIGYDARVEIMTPLIPGLIGKKMSASDSRSKVDLLDD